MMKKFLFFLCSILLTGCATENYLKKMPRYATSSFENYTVAYWYHITEPHKTLKIYIEGDENALDKKGEPSLNPTPEKSLMSQLATGDYSANVVYLARPCQYVMSSACSPKDWTENRFNPKMIASMNQALQKIIKKASADKIVLIGYEGGAWIALQLALLNPQKTQEVITIAGILDPYLWAKKNEVSLSFAQRFPQKDLNQIPQRHYVGARDKIYSLDLAKEVLGENNPALIIVKGATNNRGYKAIYQQIWQDSKENKQ